MDCFRGVECSTKLFASFHGQRKGKDVGFFL